jgi:hypothetical protein
MNDALDRVVRAAGGAEVFEALAARLSGADLTTLLLEVMRVRAGRLSAAEVLARYDHDRFVAPAAVAFDRLRRVEDAVLSALPACVEMLTLAPVVPMGTHSVVGTVNQNAVVSTIRGSEVAADPTNGLALEAARRRRAALRLDPRSTEPVHLGALQRVVRAQLFSGPGRFAHFALLGLVSAGRDTGDLTFERSQAVAHVRAIAAMARAAGATGVEARVTVFDPRYQPVADELISLSDVDVSEGPDPRASYYTGLCFKVFAEDLELGDGGFVTWTQALLGNRKERLLTSALGLDRLALSPS